VFENLRADLARSMEHNTSPREPAWLRAVRVLCHSGTQAVMVYRLGRWARGLRVPVVREALTLSYFVLRYLSMVTSGVSISRRAEIGKGLVVHTGWGVFVPPIRIGENCYLQHGIVIAHDVLEIGHNVYFGPGAKVYGRLRIGDNVRIGANSVITRDVPSDHTAAGNPMRIMPRALYKRAAGNEAIPTTTLHTGANAAPEETGAARGARSGVAGRDPGREIADG
jgi:serine O-acetyltransferase